MVIVRLSPIVPLNLSILSSSLQSSILLAVEMTRVTRARRLLSAVSNGYTNVSQLYREAQARLPFTEQECNMLNNAMVHMHSEIEWNRTLYKKGVPPFLLGSMEFRDKFIRHADADAKLKQHIREHVISAVAHTYVPKGDSKGASDTFSRVYESLVPLLLQFVQQEMPKTMLVFHGARHMADLTRPRCDASIRRHVVAHLGPPNSGKTYEAHRKLIGSATGVYCSPLRVLAWEMHQKLLDASASCSLLTGQENRSSEGDTHISCTVEMTPLERDYNCAVLDEMQMIGDANRGFAWTRVFLSIRTPELHICGSSSCYVLAKHLANICSDTIEIRDHKRLGGITVLEEAVAIDQLRPGDCVVCFSRATALQVLEDIEKTLLKNDGSKPTSTAIVYGALPPEIRTQQIEAFNERTKQILVASDVIGMGVNVRIKRVLFHRVLKYDGEKKRLLTASEIQQIAGRGGRYSLDCGTGYVGCLRTEDIAYVKRMMSRPQEQIEHAMIGPTQHTLAAFANAIRNATDPPANLAQAIQIYANMVHTERPFAVCDLQNMTKLAKALDNIDMPNEVLIEYLFVPLGMQPALVLILRAFALSHAVLNHVKLRNILHQDAIDLLDSEQIKLQNTTLDELRRLETLYQILDAYVWLWHKFPTVYVDYKAVVHKKSRIANLLQQILETQITSASVHERSEEHDDDIIDVNVTRQLIRTEHC